jgi:hypothetical protein
MKRILASCGGVFYYFVPVRREIKIKIKKIKKIPKNFKKRVDKA